MIKTLQAGRFFAAMAVVFHHAIVSMTAFIVTPQNWVQGVLEYGYLGVDFFFVLSGFIIHFTMSAAPQSARHFTYDRFTRIMLPYWPIGLTVAFAYAALPGLSATERSWGWVSTVTLLPTELPPALSVAWTLQHELVFYLIYAVLFFSRKVLTGLSAWTVAIIFVNLLIDVEAPILKIVCAPINVEFVAGVLAAQVFMKGWHVGNIISVVIFSACLLSFVMLGGERGDSWLVGFSIATLLPWICKNERSGIFSVPNWLVFGGAISYAIYLVHNPLLSLTSRACDAMGIGWFAALILSALASAAAGVAYYLFWERPVMRAVKRPNAPKNRVLLH